MLVLLNALSEPFVYLSLLRVGVLQPTVGVSNGDAVDGVGDIGTADGGVDNLGVLRNGAGARNSVDHLER